MLAPKSRKNIKLVFSPSGDEYFTGYTTQSMLLKTEVFAIMHLMKKHPNACVYLGDVDANFQPDPDMSYLSIGFEWDVPKLKLKVPDTPSFWQFAVSCRESGVRFVVTYLILNAEDVPISRMFEKAKAFDVSNAESSEVETMDPHANMLIIDWERKTLERFEPNGGFFDVQYKGYGLDELNKQLTRLSKKYGLEYLPPKFACPNVGLQATQHSQFLKNNIFIEGDVGGWCQTWSVFYADMRLSYPDIDPQSLMQLTLNAFKNKDMSKWIRDYMYNIVKDSKAVLTLADVISHVKLFLKQRTHNTSKLQNTRVLRPRK